MTDPADLPALRQAIRTLARRHRQTREMVREGEAGEFNPMAMAALQAHENATARELATARLELMGLEPAPA